MAFQRRALCALLALCAASLGTASQEAACSAQDGACHPEEPDEMIALQKKAIHVVGPLAVKHREAAKANITFAETRETLESNKTAQAQASNKTVQTQVAAPVETPGAWGFYQYSLIPMLLISVSVAAYTMPQAEGKLSDEFRASRAIFIVVWALAAAADWLQGPYVYALYSSYGYSDADISGLFVAGFGASMVFGMFAGATADSIGRKRCAVAYCVLYIVSCMTKHSNWYPMLFAGRITGGIATSLLFSTFECWMIAEHNRNNYGAALLRYMFSLMYLVNYLVAASMGILAQAAVAVKPLTKVTGMGFESVHYGGFLAPFDMAIVILIVLIPLICYLWEENYGDENQTSVVASLVAAAGLLANSWRLCVLGMSVASFEGCMYFFVLKWTPALGAGGMACPHGLVFSVFMMACMCGASACNFFDSDMHPTRALLPIMFTSAVLFASIAQVVGQPGMVHCVYLAFVVFEACVGIYFPTIGALKSELVPERARAGVYNAYRAPLNLVVIAITMTKMTEQMAFMAGSALLLVAFAGVGLLAASREAPLKEALVGK